LGSTTPRWGTGYARTASTGGEAEGLTTEEQARLGQLEAENTKLRMERDLLKRTVAFWVKETSTP
jgi:transposase